jgi:putative endonuclease
MRKKGAFYEQKALDYLLRHHYKLITRNYTCIFGEIDLLMVKPPCTLVVVEVRFRQSLDDARLSITPMKIKKIIRTLEHFLGNHDDFSNMDIQFDCIFLNHHWINHMKQAFDLTTWFSG